MNAWGSHLPALLGCILSTGGSVLEVGVGHFSTPHLHTVCAVLKRELCSLDANEEWIAAFEDQFATNNHHFICGEYAELVPLLANESWSVAFIDHSAITAQRVSDFSRLIKRSDYVLVHDYHADNEREISRLLSGLNVHVCRTYQPPTLVASARFPIPDVVKIL